MDKYDTPEKKPAEMKKSPTKAGANPSASAAQVQDAELRIL
jgi:hypothetical protein